jgi:hypothetical protein
VAQRPSSADALDAICVKLEEARIRYTESASAFLKWTAEAPLGAFLQCIHVMDGMGQCE